MIYKLIVTPKFTREAKTLFRKYNSLKQDLFHLFEILEKALFQGTPLGRDCFKIRMAISSKGKGKSDGARVITCVRVTVQSVFSLTIYDKSDKESLSDREINHLLENL